jgi:hypothetical protein
VVVEPIVTTTPRPAPLGGLVVQDFAALPVVVVAPPPPPPALEVVLKREDPRRHRLLRLSLEVGDNLFRRGRTQEARRHFALAFSLAGPRREISLRLDACRDAAPPPAPAVVLPPVTLTPAAPLPVVVVQPVVVRPRLAVFGFLVNSDPGLVPPAVGDWAADQFASCCGNYELIDRGEVCWYMGRLGLTMRDVLRDDAARRCLAQALNARFFVFGVIQQTASFNVSTHLFDTESGARTGTAMIHVQDHQELKLLAHELAHQMGVRPDEQKRLQEQAAATEKSLREARELLRANHPDKAAEVAREALKTAPDNIALQAVRTEAERQQRLAAFEAARRKEAADRALALQAEKKRREAFIRVAEEARKRAEAEANARTAAERARQRQERERAAGRLIAQAGAARARKDDEQAVRLLKAAAALKGDEATFRQLAEAQAAADRAAREREQRAREAREDARKAQVAAAVARVQKEKEALARADAERRKAHEAWEQAQYAGFVKQAKDQMAKKTFEGYEAALSASRSAQRVKATEESAALVRQTQYLLALADAERKGAEAKRKLEAERKAREAAEEQARRNQAAYLAALKKGQEALAAKKYGEAAGFYDAAGKLFRTDAALNGKKTADLLAKREADLLAAEKRKKETNLLVKDLSAKGQKAFAEKKYTDAVTHYRKAKELAPDNVAVRTALAQAEHEQALEAQRTRPPVVVKPVKPATGPTAKQMEDYKLALSAGRDAVKKNNLSGAINAYKEALRIIPGDRTATEALGAAQRLQADAVFADWMRQGGAAMKASKFADAAKAYDEALKVRPGDKVAVQGKRDALAKMTAKPETPKPVTPAVDPKVAERRAAYQKAMTAAKAAVAQKKFAEADKLYGEALANVPGDAIATKDRAEAARLLKEQQETAKKLAEMKKREEDYAKLIKSAQAALAAKKYPDALKMFTEALKANGSDLVALQGKKDAEAGLKKPAPADPKLKQRMEDYKLAMDAAAAAVKAKNYAGAVNAYKEALRLMPGDKAATDALASAQRLQQSDEAMKRDAAYANWMKQGNAALAQKKYAEAVKAFDEVLKLKPGDAAGIKGKKDAEAGLKKPAPPPPPPPVKPAPPPVKPAPPPPPPAVNPQAEYDKAMQQGKSLEAQKKYADAANAYRNAVKAVVADPKKNPAVNSHYFNAYMGVGRSEHAAKRYAEAVKAYEEALKRMPNQADAKAALQRARAGKP